MDAFTMWKEKIVFLDGWFICMNVNGNNSIISHDRARMLELHYQSYQASMDVGRGGLPDEVAYPSRGFTYKDNKYVYEKFCVDQLILGNVNTIPSILQIPKTIGNIEINSISNEAFKNELAIERVILHDNINVIGESAFEGCKRLSNINLPNRHIEIKKDAFKDTLLCSEKVSYLNNVLFKVETSFKGSLKVREGTLAIADEALRGCTEITEIDLPDGLISVGEAAFEKCEGLTNLVVPESVQTIGEYAFDHCTNLAKIKLPKYMEKIGTSAFSNCKSLNTLILPEGICEIERGVFWGCTDLLQVNIPKTVQKISFTAFIDSGIMNAYISSDENELYIDNWLIHYKSDNIETLTVKDRIIGISDMDWSRKKKIRSVEFPKSIKYIGDNAFSGALFDYVKLPKGLISIGESAFRGTALKEIVIPGTVEDIGIWAFMDCENLESITFKNAATNINFPTITGRKDKKSIVLNAPSVSTARNYCSKYGKENYLIFKPLTIGFFQNLIKK